MHDELRRILKWSVIGAIIAFGIDWLVTGGLPFGHRVTLGLMAAGAGFVTAALLAANFVADEEHGSKDPGGAEHH
jgi:hypothetical protein